MTKKETKERRVDDVLAAAMAEFVDKGYEGTSMDSIAARAGLTKGGLYYHFKNKDDVLIRANERFMEPVGAMIGAAMAAENAAVGLALYIRSYLAYWAEHPRELAFVFLTMTKAIANPVLAPVYSGYTAKMVGFFEALYSAGAESRVFRPLDTHAAALTLMTALDGAIGYLVIDSDLSLEQTTASFCAMFVDGLRGEVGIETAGSV